MYPAVGLVSLAAMFAAVIYGWRQMSLRQIALERLAQTTDATAAALGRRTARPLRRSWWWLPWVAACIAGTT